MKLRFFSLAAGLFGFTLMSHADEAIVTLRGTLQGGMMGIGGESTGVSLQNVSIEVDASQLEDAGDLLGQEVYLQGSFYPKQYLERGSTWIFRAIQGRLTTAGKPPGPIFKNTEENGAEPDSDDEDLQDRALELLRSDPAFRAKARQMLAAIAEPQ